jgi:Domain of unknown function (DUF4105)
MKADRTSLMLRALVVLFSVTSTGFAVGVLWYQGPEAWFVRTLLIGAWVAFSVVCSVWFFRRSSVRPLVGYGAAFVAIVLWLGSIEPRNDRVWSSEMAHTLSYVRDGDTIILSNVRNFNWTGPATAVERWENRRYDLNALKSVDVLSLYWKGPRIAHTYFSFVWATGEALSISVEIRKELGEGYSPIGGFFKAYELAILAGDERDFYGWRIFFPTEDIQLFRTRATPLEARALLLALLDSANELAMRPVFYNTLTENCTTEVWMLTDALGAGKPFDSRILASGYLPEFLYDLKILDTARPLTVLRDEGRILPAARTALARGLAGPAFSRTIRETIPPFSTSPG